MSKYDWAKLKREYLTGDYKSLREFAEAKDINYAVLRQNAAEWSKEKLTIDSQKTNKIIEGVTEREIQYEIDRNAAHLAAGDLIMMQVNLALQALKSKDKNALYLLNAAATTLEKVQKVQRLGDGLGAGNEVSVVDDL